VAYKNGQKAIRLREISARLKELEAEDKLIQGPDRSSPDARDEIARIAVERKQLRAERDDLLADPDPEPGPIREEIARMWTVIAAFNNRISDWHSDAERLETARELRRANERDERQERQKVVDRWFVGLAFAAGIQLAVAIAALTIANMALTVANMALTAAAGR
jgi:hypothetical protein